MQYQPITFGTYRLKDNTLSEALTAAFDSGYRAIDTALLYNNQQIIGEFLGQNQLNRNEIWITSKLPPKIISMTENDIINSVVKTFDDLRTPYVDLYLLHCPVKDHNTKAWSVIEGFHRQGYLRNIGVSNYDINDIKEISNFSTTSIFTNQLELSPFLTRPHVTGFLKSVGIPITAHSSLAKGEKFNNPVLQSISDKYSRTPAQILLKWALQNQFHIIPRSSKHTHIYEDINLGFNISDDDMMELNGLNIGYTTHPQYKFVDSV